MRFAPLAVLPKAVLGLGKELARHILRRPVVGISAAARTRDGRWVLIRRADTGTWGLPGGTLEWGETLTDAIHRELAEEAGVTEAVIGRVVGVWSRPDRDLRFHAVTVVVTADVEPPSQSPHNPLEIREVRLFRDDELPAELAMGSTVMLEAARRGESSFLE
jgi:8-oxo-dGTP diphosphatase